MQKMIHGVRGFCLENVDSFSMSTTYCDKEFVARLGVLLEQNKEEALAIQQRNRQYEIRRYALESIMHITKTEQDPHRCEKMLVRVGTVPHEPEHVVNIRVPRSPTVRHRDASPPPFSKRSRNQVPYHRRLLLYSRGHC